MNKSRVVPSSNTTTPSPPSPIPRTFDVLRWYLEKILAAKGPETNTSPVKKIGIRLINEAGEVNYWTGPQRREKRTIDKRTNVWDWWEREREGKGSCSPRAGPSTQTVNNYNLFPCTFDSWTDIPLTDSWAIESRRESDGTLKQWRKNRNLSERWIIYPKQVSNKIVLIITNAGNLVHIKASWWHGS